MKAVDSYSIDEAGIPSVVLMERAALAVSGLVIRLAGEESFSGQKRGAVKESFAGEETGLGEESFSGQKRGTLKKQVRVLCVCGKGNNGADGLAAARQLSQAGFNTDVYEVGKDGAGTREYELQKNILKNLHVSFVDLGQDNIVRFCEYDFIIDAVFGIGLSRDAKGLFAEVIGKINAAGEAGTTVVSVDIPSGISAGDGRVCGAAVRADYTVTFGFNKLGMALYPGREYAGRVTVADIGFAVRSEDGGFKEPGVIERIVGRHSVRAFEKRDLRKIPKRSGDANKGGCGKVLIAAGSESMGGAACLSAEASYRTGCGLVRVFTHENNRIPLLSLVPEAIPLTYKREPGEEELAKLKESCLWADCIVAGPGLSVTDSGRKILQTILSSGAKAPLVIDADALNILSESADASQRLAGYTGKIILTPHVGEMARLTGKSISEIKSRSVSCASEYAKKTGAVCVLKDAATVVSDGSSSFVNMSGNCGMATAGSGDVLTGVIAGLVCAGFDDVFTAAAAAVYVHGLAGDICRERLGEYSMKAWDLTAGVSVVLAEAGR